MQWFRERWWEFFLNLLWEEKTCHYCLTTCHLHRSSWPNRFHFQVWKSGKQTINGLRQISADINCLMLLKRQLVHTNNELSTNVISVKYSKSVNDLWNYLWWIHPWQALFYPLSGCLAFNLLRIHWRSNLNQKSTQFRHNLQNVYKVVNVEPHDTMLHLFGWSLNLKSQGGSITPKFTNLVRILRVDTNWIHRNLLVPPKIWSR